MEVLIPAPLLHKKCPKTAEVVQVGLTAEVAQVVLYYDAFFAYFSVEGSIPQVQSTILMIFGNDWTCEFQGYLVPFVN